MSQLVKYVLKILTFCLLIILSYDYIDRKVENNRVFEFPEVIYHNDRNYETKQINGVFKAGPKAILTISYGESPIGFKEGDYYVLKVLKIRDTKVDYGFCRLNVGG